MEQKIDVLIADHQKDSRRGLKALLGFSPFINHIWEARNGEAAIKVISEVKPNLVILDVHMPLIGGLGVARWIQHNCPEIKVIPDAKPGDWTIVHAGFALNLLSEEEAQETLDILQEMSDLADELGEGS
mgnify:CR=1 FL=1